MPSSTSSPPIERQAEIAHAPPSSRREQALAHPWQVLATPIKVTVGKQEARHAEYAGGLCHLANLAELATALTVEEACELAAGSATLLQDRGQGGRAFELQLALPKPREDAIMIGAKDAMALGKEHADVGKR